MDRRVEADHVAQVGRAHGPTEFFHHPVDALEVDAVVDQRRQAAEIREEDAVDQEAGAVVDDDRRLAEREGVGDRGGDGRIAALRAADDLDQRHHVHRVEEVHPAEILGALQGLGQAGDRNGRGVGRQDRVLLDVGFQLRQHGLLDLLVFDDRLDHDVDGAEVAVGQGGRDHRDDLGHLRRVDLSALELLAQQFLRLAHAEFERLVGDVLHQDRRSPGGRLVGDTAAHDAGAEDGGVPDLAPRPGDGIALLLVELVGQEDRHEAFGDVGMRHPDEALDLEGNGVVALAGGALLHRLDGRDRRRVVGSGPGHDEALGAGEDHRALDRRAQLQRLQLFLPLGAPVDVALDALRQQVEGRVAQPVGLDHHVDRADFQRRLVPVVAAAGDPFDGVVRADEPRQANGAAPARIDTELGLRQADLGRGGHRAIRMRQAVLEAAAERGAVDGRDARDVEVFEVVERLVGLGQPGRHLLVRQLEVLAEFLDVGAGDEHLLGAGRKHALEAGGGSDRIDCLAEFPQRGRVELVDGFALRIEDDLGDIAVDPFDPDRVTVKQDVVGHESSLIRRERARKCAFGALGLRLVVSSVRM